MAEAYFQTGPVQGMAAGENFLGVGTYTMPFAGSLAIELYVEIYWPGEYSPGIWLSVTGSPATNGTADLGISMPGFDPYWPCRQNPRTHAWWGSLAAGTVVTGWARVYSTIGGGVVVVNYVGGFWRAAPA